MKHNSDEEIDNFIRSKLARLDSARLARLETSHQVQPSADFTGRVMKQVGLLERRRRWIGYLAAVFLSLTPLAVREIWMLIRGDYFSASSLPMGRLIVGAYQFLLSPAALYILLALGILAFLLRANKLRRNWSSSPRIA